MIGRVVHRRSLPRLVSCRQQVLVLRLSRLGRLQTGPTVLEPVRISGGQLAPVDVCRGGHRLVGHKGASQSARVLLLLHYCYGHKRRWTKVVQVILELLLIVVMADDGQSIWVARAMALVGKAPLLQLWPNLLSSIES